MIDLCDGRRFDMFQFCDSDRSNAFKAKPSPDDRATPRGERADGCEANLFKALRRRCATSA
jgi:hypothetical protein